MIQRQQIQRQLLALAALAALSAPPLRGQSLTAAGNTVAPIVSLAAGHTIGGLDVDATGDLFYLDVDNGSPDTRLIERKPDGTTDTVYELGSSVASTAIYGAFVRTHGSEIYLGYGAGTDTTIVAGSLSGSQLQVAHSYDTGVSAYDLAFDPSGTAFLSADPNGFNVGNHVYAFDLATGTLTSKVSISMDNSGPIAFDASGNLLYGTTGYHSPAGGIYRVLKNTLAGSEIELDSSYLLTGNAGNAYFAEGANGVLYQTDFTQEILGYPSQGAGAETTFATASDGLYLGPLASGNGEIYVEGSDFGNGNYIFAIPEPGGGALVLLGAMALLGRRARRL